MTAGWKITRTAAFSGETVTRTIPNAAFQHAWTLADYLGDMAPHLDRERCERAAQRLQVYKWAPEQAGDFKAEPLPEVN